MAAPTLVQDKAGTQFGATTVAATFDSSVIAGNLLAVYVIWEDTENSITASCADGLSNSYTDVNNPTDLSGSARGAMFYAKDIAGGSCTVTVTLSSSVNAQIVIAEIAGADTATPLDDSSMNAQADPGTGTDVVTSDSITTTVADIYLFGVSGTIAATGIASGTGFVNQNELGGSSRTLFEDKTLASTATIAATWTNTASAFEDNISGIMAFKAAAAGGVNVVPLLRHRRQMAMR